jgi:hypothetical protein
MKSKNAIPVSIAGIGCVVFGTLMSLRDSFDSVWLRAVVAGCAAGVLALSYAWAFSIYKSRPEKD